MSLGAVAVPGVHPQTIQAVDGFIVRHFTSIGTLDAWIGQTVDWINSPGRSPAQMIAALGSIRDSMEAWAADAERWAAAYPSVLIQRPDGVFNFDTKEPLAEYAAYCRRRADGWADLCATREAKIREEEVEP